MHWKEASYYTYISSWYFVYSLYIETTDTKKWFIIFLSTAYTHRYNIFVSRKLFVESVFYAWHGSEKGLKPKTALKPSASV